MDKIIDIVFLSMCGIISVMLVIVTGVMIERGRFKNAVIFGIEGLFGIAAFIFILFKITGG